MNNNKGKIKFIAITYSGSNLGYAMQCASAIHTKEGGLQVLVG